MLSKTYIKYIQSLHHKKFRDTEDVFIAEGSKVVMELLRSTTISCEMILGLAEWLHQNETAIRKYYTGPMEVIEQYELEKISALTTPNQLLAVFKKCKKATTIKGKICLMLDTIQDPGNLGTIIRIADWFGVQSILCSENCADMYNPKVVQSTMGSLGRVEMIYTNLAEWMKKNNKIKTYAAALNGKNISELKKGLTEGIIIIGNESKGISEEIMQLCTEKITIPKIGEAESLNAAVAAGIILSHL